jgi:hypothetical protein
MTRHVLRQPTALALAAWAAALVWLWLAAASVHESPFHAATWAHWDSTHYLSIAQHGYDVHRCRPHETPRPATWCGNTAWFPLYPWLIAAVHAAGLSALVAGVAISWFFAAVVLLLLGRVPLLALLYAAFAPGYVYEFAVFPLSVFVAAVVTFLGAVRTRRWTLAAAAGFLAGLAYPIGVIVLPVVGLLYVGWTTRRPRPTALATLPPLLAFGVVVLVQRAQTGRWTAFFDVQRQYGHGFHDPFALTWNAIHLVSFRWGAAPYWQTLLVTIVLVLVVVLGRRERLLVLYALVAWAVPLTQANVSIWRSQDALLPVAPIVGRFRRYLAGALVAAAVAIGFAVARLYFEGGLV